MIHQIIDFIVDTKYNSPAQHIIAYTLKGKEIRLKRYMKGVYTISCMDVYYAIHNDTDLPNPYHRWIVVNDNDPDDILGPSTHLANAIDKVIEYFNILESNKML